MDGFLVIVTFRVMLPNGNAQDMVKDFKAYSGDEVAEKVSAYKKYLLSQGIFTLSTDTKYYPI